MQANVRVKAKEDVDKQKEKERKREEKELRKIAAANGIKMTKTPSSLAAVPVPESGSLAAAPGMSMDMNMDIDGGKSIAEPKASGGWASLSASQGPVHSQGGFRKSGWATIGPSSSSNFQSTSAIDRQPPSSHPTTPSNSITSHHNPTFRNAGWSSLDTSSSQLIPVTNQTSFSHGGGSCSKGLATSRDESGSTQLKNPTLAPPPSEPGSLQSLSPVPPVPPTIPKPVQVPQAKPPRSNWQQFQKGAGRRK